MKFFNYVGLIGMLLMCAIACNKEEVQINNDPVETTVSESVSFNAIIKNAEDDSKTSYTAGKFSWTKDDAVRVLTWNGVSLNHNTFTADASSASSTITGGTVPDGYDWVGYAVYPSTISYSGTNEAVKLVLPESETYVNSAYESSFVYLIGKQNADDKDYIFNTAVGLLKLTFEGLPTDIKYVTLQNDGYNFAGTFPIEKEGDYYVVKSESAVSGTEIHSKTFALSLETSDNNAKDRSFYFPVPVGTIPAGTKIQIRTVLESEPIYTLTANASIPVSRTKILDLGTIPTWKTLDGQAKFIDYFTFETVLGRTAKWVDVTIQQNIFTPTYYRMLNPYAAAFEVIGYEPTVSPLNEKDSEFFTFKTLEEGESFPYYSKTVPVGAGTVVYYDLFYATYIPTTAPSYRNSELRITHANYQNINALTNTRVTDFRADGKPGRIVLHPYISFRRNGAQVGADGTSGGANVDHTSSAYANQFIILFPDYNSGEVLSENAAKDFALSASLNSGSTSSAISLDISYGSDITEVRAVISSLSIEAAVAKLDASRTTADADVTVISSGDGAYLLTLPSQSGKYNIYVRAYGDDSYGARNWAEIDNIYVLTSEDKTSLVGQFNVNGAVYWTGDWGSSTTSSFTFAESEDVVKGNIKLTEFDGKSANKDLYGQYDGSTKTLTFGSSYLQNNPLYVENSTNYYFLNGTTANNVTFFLDNPDNDYYYCYVSSSSAGIATKGWTWKRVYRGYAYNNTKTNFSGKKAK